MDCEEARMLDREISKRIWVTRYVMVIGIVILHLPPYQGLSELDGSIFEYVKAFFAHGVFRASVPVLTVMSGYLIFATKLYTKPVKLLKKKVSTLLIPLIVWNLPLAVLVY
jgi:succinoglycan biosynthesis protein ExoH